MRASGGVTGSRCFLGSGTGLTGYSGEDEEMCFLSQEMTKKNLLVGKMKIWSKCVAQLLLYTSVVMVRLQLPSVNTFKLLVLVRDC